MPKTLADTLAARETMYAGRDRRPVFFTVIPDYQGQHGSGTATGNRLLSGGLRDFGLSPANRLNCAADNVPIVLAARGTSKTNPQWPVRPTPTPNTPTVPAISL